MRNVVLIGLSGLVAIGLLIGLVLGPMVFRWYAAPWTGKLQEREIVTRGAYRIQGYENFYRWQEEADAVKAKIGNYAGADLDPRERIECRGLRAQHADIVQKYNAASRAERTQGQWRVDDLPETLTNEGIPECSD